MTDGRIMHLGRATIKGNSSIEQKVPLKGLREAPRAAVLSYNNDVLAARN